jgi:hypothetical protein
VSIERDAGKNAEVVAPSAWSQCGDVFLHQCRDMSFDVYLISDRAGDPRELRLFARVGLQ